MKKLTRRSLLVGASTSTLSAISYGLFVNTAKGGTPNQTVWTNAGAASDQGNGDMGWTAGTLGNITSHGSYVTGNGRIGRFAETNILWAYDYGFSIPGNAVIDGIQTRYDAGADSDYGWPYGPTREVRESRIVLTKPSGGGVAESPSKTPNAPGNAIWSCANKNSCDSCLKGLNYSGGSGDVWFTDGLTPGDVNSEDFGIRIQGENMAAPSRCAWMDVMMIKVYYTTP